MRNNIVINDFYFVIVVKRRATLCIYYFKV